MGKWNGRDFLLKDGETKLYPKFLAEKFAENMAIEILHELKQDIYSKDKLNELASKMLGNEMVDIDFPDKSDVDLIIEEIEYANNTYLNNQNGE